MILMGILSTFNVNASDNVLPASNKTLLVLGDSLSAGYGVNLTQAWVSLLQKKLVQAKYPYQVINASVSGETSAGGLSRLQALLERHRPAIVVIELGANDGLRGLPIASMKANLKKMIALSQKAKARVLLLGMRMPPNYGPAYTQSFAQAYMDLAHEQQVAVYDQEDEQIGRNRERDTTRGESCPAPERR